MMFILKTDYSQNRSMYKITLMFHCSKVIYVIYKSLDSFKTVLYGWFFLKHVQHVTVFNTSN